jgi:NTE family protein
MVSVLVLLALSGCTGIGPTTISRDRFDYTAAISDSWKRQMLFNMVRIRYGDAPVFLDVSSVISQYQIAGQINVGATFNNNPWSASEIVGATGNYVDRPTITYTPILGDKFARSLMSPIPPPDRGRYMGTPGNSQNLLLYLTFSGGGTRAAAFSYGVLEELRKTEVTIDGNRRRLLDEVDWISSVSGGSFTAGYYGLFGDRIFEDFESKFLKKNIQGALAAGIFLNPINWFRLSSAYFDRSDLAAEYYDKHVFEGGTFGDITARKGPMIMMNATDMTHGLRIGFNQDAFDIICSDLSNFPVARAAAASSAVPMLLTPITVRNYAGTCDFKVPERFEEMLKSRTISERQFYLANNVSVYLNSQKKAYIHLLDGGVADNLGLRAILDRVIGRGSVWRTIQGTPMENIHKAVFMVVNAETEQDSKWDRSEVIPPFGAMFSSYSSISIERYNEATIALL